MTNSIDSRIVEMKFDNAAFERGVLQTMSTLDNLDKKLQLQNASKGLNDVNAAAQRTKLDHIAGAVDSISQRFSALSVVAITALSTITNKAVTAGSQMVKSLTLDPVMQGFSEYETKLKSIQTILANTQAAGTNLKDVSTALQELNDYSDQTIYNFAEMAKNIGTFTAAGVDLQTATGSIKGIANLAALSGSNSEQASRGMYQLSQAISSGRVSLEDWNSVVASGMGGTVFQRALAQTAQKMGTLSDDAVKLTGKMKNATINGKSFRESITARPGQKSWLTSEVLTKTLQQFTGDLTDAQLKAEGFSDAQIKAIQAQAATAKAAATEVKTATQLMGTLQESAGSGWAQTWELIIGDFDEAKKLWTGANNVFGGLIQQSADARNKLIGDWKKMGGRTILIQGIKDGFEALSRVVKPIKDAFREIFPATTAKQLVDITKNFANFMKSLQIGSETAGKLKRTFAGVFAIFGIAWEVIKQVASAIGDLFGEFSGAGGGILDITSKIGDFIVKLHDAVKNGDGLKNFLSGLVSVLKVPIKLFKAAGSAISDFFSNLDLGKLDGFTGKMEPLKALGSTISSIWGKVTSVFDNVAGAMSGSGGKAADIFNSIGDAITNALQNIDFDKVLGALNTGLFAGLVLLVKKFVGSFGDAADSFVGLTDRLMSPFDQLTDTLGAMQNTLRAATLLQIAIAVGVLAASTVALSKIDSEGLTRALVALTIMFTQLTIAMAIFQKIDIGGGMLQLILIATALRILTSSVVALADLDWEDLAKGLTGTAVLLGALIATAKLMPDGKKMISSSIGMVILAGAIKILVSSVTDLGGMDWEELAKGLSGVAALLVSLALFTKFAQAGKAGVLSGAGLVLLAVGIKILASAMADIADLSWEDIGKGLLVVGVGLGAMGAALALIPPSSIINAASIFIVAASLSLISDALSDMGGMEWEEIGKGLALLGGALLLIGLALTAMPPTSIISAGALFVVASSLGLLTDALQQMGDMGWENIAKGLVLLGGALLIISVAMIAMTGALPGAAALLVVSASLAILAPILQLFSQMSWGEIVKGLVMLAGVFAVIGVAGLLLTPVIPTLLGLGIAIGLLGIGIAAAGVGVLAFSLGLTALAAAGGAATLAIVGIVSGLIGLIPMVMEQIGLGLVAFAKVIATAGPAITDAITTVLMALLNAIQRISPKAVQVLLQMLYLMLNALEKAVPKMVNSGMRIVTGILDGVAKNIGKVVQKATDVIVAFINGVAKAQPRIVDAGVKMIIAFVNGLADAIRKNSAQMSEAGRNLADAIVQGMANGISGGLGIVTDAAKRLARSALDAAKNLLGIRSPSREFAKLGKFSAEGYAKGLTGSKSQILAAAKTMRDLLKESMANAKDDIEKYEARLKKLNAAKKKDTDAIRATTRALAEARAEYARSSKAYAMTKTWNDEYKRLTTMATKLDSVGKKLADANKKLEDARKTRDDYNKSVRDQYSDLPDISGDTKLTDYITGLQKKVVDTQIFTAQLQKLRSLGLNDTMYKELLGKGLDAMPFVQQILEGGKNSVTELNTLGSALSKSATNLGNSASAALYQAAVDSAAGLVKGLQNQQAALEKQMDKLADAMVRAIKKKLGIKSPSRVFAEVGDWSARGLADGLQASSAPIDAAEKTGIAAIEAMRKTMSDLPSIVNANMDTTPTIRPVLDLTDVKKDAGLIGSMISTRPLEVGSAYSLASGASRDMRAAEAYALEKANLAGTPTQVLNFNQTNNSPKALPAAEIYRKNKSLISTAKEALKK